MTEHHRLLVVEDHADSRLVLAKLLRHHGYEVVAVSNIVEAVRACNELPFDVCITDIGLCDGTGYDLMRELRAIHKIKAIACSGYDRQQEIERARSAGFTEYLTKPLDIKLLLAKLGSLLQEEPVLLPAGD